MKWLERLLIWKRIRRLEDDFTVKKVNLATLQKLVGKPSEPDWGVMPEIRKLRAIAEGKEVDETHD